MRRSGACANTKRHSHTSCSTCDASRAWPVWSGVTSWYDRAGAEEHRDENLDGGGFRAELPVDEDDVVLDYQGVFRRIG